MSITTVEEALIAIAEYAQLQMHREKTSRTYAKRFYQCIGQSQNAMDKVTIELNSAPEGKVRILKQLMPYNDVKEGFVAIIEEYELL